MRKILNFIVIFLIAFFTFSISVNASSVSLDSLTVTLSKTKIEPGEEIKVKVEFGEELGAYTFDVAYDKNIFEYVSTDGGTENDNGTRVRVTYYDSTGGSNPRSNMSVTFKAKDELVTTNPTDFSVTAEGLANSDASQSYDDITTPIKKNVIVEPKYVDYTIKLNYVGDITVEEEKNMELVTESSLGQGYDHVKMKVEVTQKPSNDASVKLLATERTRQEVDLIQDGWGEPDGYELGGKDVKQILDIRALFSKAGKYNIKISLLDKDTSNALIATENFEINVKNVNNTEDGNQNGNNEVGGGVQGNEINNNEIVDNEIEGDLQENEIKNEVQENEINNSEVAENGNLTNNEIPENLPKTGMTQYVYIITALVALSAGYVALKNNKK